MNSEKGPSGHSGGRRAAIRVLGAVGLCAVGVVLLGQRSAASDDVLLVTFDGRTYEVPIESDVVSELEDLTGPGGVLSRDPGVSEFRDDLSERRAATARVDWPLYGAVGSFLLAAVLLLMAFSGAAQEGDEAV